MLTVKVYSTTEWRARPAKGNIPKTLAIYIVIHHTGMNATVTSTESGRKLAQAIQRYHMDVNGWMDSGHNFLITQTGDIFEGRHGSLAAVLAGQSVLSAHSGNAAANASPGIEMEGNFSSHTMRKTQWSALVAFCTELCRLLKLKPSSIKGHRDFKRTNCPGNWLYANLLRLRSEVAQQLAQATA
jgi:hypothetical protein